MSVEQTTASLKSLLDRFPSERDAILNDVTRMQDSRLEQVNALFATRAAAARNLVVTLWGEINEDENFVRTLSDASECWTRYHRAERILADAQETAQREAISPEYVAHARMRAEAIVASLTPDDDFLKVYRYASQDEQRALQDYAPTLFNQSPFAKNGVVAQWLGQLTYDRQQRLNTPAVQAAATGLEQATGALMQALDQTKRAAALFANVGTSDAYPFHIGEYLNGVQLNRERDMNSNGMNWLFDFQSKAWGHVTRNAHGVLAFGG